jgi:cytochrome P450
MLAARYEDGGAMTDPQIRDELFTLLVAGHETTAIALAWAMYWLHRNPDTLERLRAELADPRRRPRPRGRRAPPLPRGRVQRDPAPLPDPPARPAHRLKADDSSARTRSPPACYVGFCPAIVHTNPVLYPEPHAFKPERWLTRKFAPFEFIPFGGGIRRCIGAAFALYEMKLVLAAILPRHRFVLLDDRPIRPQRRNLTLGPTGGIRMILIERKPD